MDGVVNGIVGFLTGKIPSWVIIMFVSMIPILELRGSLLAAGILEMEFLPSFLAAVIGNMIPIPFILLFIEKIFSWMKKREKLGKIARKLEEKTIEKSDNIKKYGKVGLMLFVGIPLPGTGAWTGALAAILLGMKPKEAFLPIFFGVVIAGFIVSALSFGLIQAII